MLNRCIALTGMFLMLTACSSTVDDSNTMDDGTVNGATTEDAGGDGTNTTGGAMHQSSMSSLDADAMLKLQSSYSSTFSQ